jgi:phosphoribosylformimino-5-aminoimidazole carboxamide ribotide isomerase
MINSFTVYPAIDLRGGMVVRLAQGDPDRQTVFGDDPLAWVERWKAAGAEWLHVVNLSGAFGEDGSANLLALGRIVGAGMKVEFGGGLRDEAALRAVLDLGVQRVFLGTAAVRDPAFLDKALALWGPARIAGDIGHRDGKVLVQGWQQATPLQVLEVGRRFRAQGIEQCVLTDVNRDGIGSGLDLRLAVELQSATGLNIVASGGVSRLDEVRAARLAKLAGIVLGRALYDEKIRLEECLKQ